MPFPINETTRDAIKHHFKRKKLVWNETYFVDVLQSSEKKHDIYWAVLALRDCGTAYCIPMLKEKLQYPMQDVKCCAMLTIAHIAGATETPTYAHAIVDPEYRNKGYAMWTICDAADSRAVDAVLAYFKKNRSKIKNGNLLNAALVDGLDYLEKYRNENVKIQEFFCDVDSFWDNLPEGNRREISNRVPFFSAYLAVVQDSN